MRGRAYAQVVFSSEVKFSSMSVHVCFTTRIAQFQISTRAAIVTSRFNPAVWSVVCRTVSVTYLRRKHHLV